MHFLVETGLGLLAVSSELEPAGLGGCVACTEWGTGCSLRFIMREVRAGMAVRLAQGHFAGRPIWLRCPDFLPSHWVGKESPGRPASIFTLKC